MALSKFKSAETLDTWSMKQKFFPQAHKYLLLTGGVAHKVNAEPHPSGGIADDDRMNEKVWIGVAVCIVEHLGDD